MGFLASGIFWGAVVIILGVSIILKAVFNIDLHIFRILIGIFFIYLGIRFISGGWGRHWHAGNSTVFGNAKMKYVSDQNDYSVVFGNGEFDLSTIRSVIDNRKVEISVVFGNGRVHINDSLPIIIYSNTAFGNTVLPDRRSTAFGDITYTSPSYVAGQPHLEIETNVVFGKLEVIKGQW